MRPGRRVLRPGCSGVDVKALQHKLGLPADGIFGPDTADAVRDWKQARWEKRHPGRKRDRRPGPNISRSNWRALGFSTREWWPLSRYQGLTPGQIVNRLVVESQGKGFPHMTLQHVREANANHGPVVNGNRSDHQGPPAYAWAADISNASSPTREMDDFARLIARVLHGPWRGDGISNWYLPNGYRVQLLYRTDIGGNHWNHVHLGIRR